MLAGVHQQATGQEQGPGAARGDQDALGVDTQAITLLVETTDGLAQFRQATGGGVAGFAVGQRGLAGLDDRFGGGEVRLADFQMNHIMACGL